MGCDHRVGVVLPSFDRGQTQRCTGLVVGLVDFIASLASDEIVIIVLSLYKIDGRLTARVVISGALGWAGPVPLPYIPLRLRSSASK